MNSALKYLTEVREEFNHVSWSTRQEAVRLTLFVVGGSLLVGLFVGGTDAVLLKGLDAWIKLWTI
jgi:preprotein translocase SecE subunit